MGQSQLLGFDGKFSRSSCRGVKNFPGRVPISRPPIAQLVEQLPFKEKVPGSIPGGRTGDRESRYFISGQLPFKEKVAGSTPAGRTNAKHLAAMSKRPVALASGVERRNDAERAIGERGSEAVARPSERKRARAEADPCRADTIAEFMKIKMVTFV